VRLAFWRRQDDEGLPRAPPTPYDRWLFWARVGALLLAAVLLAFSFGLVALGGTAQNEGGDINITAEFYTAFENGGGFITWDFSPSAAHTLRDRLDTSPRDGVVNDTEVKAYSDNIEATLERSVGTLRNFEIGGVQPQGQRGLSGVSVNSSEPAHFQVKFAGQWAQRDIDIPMANDVLPGVEGGLSVLGLAGNLTGGERIHERTSIIAGGVATFSADSGDAHIVRVPGGTMAVVTRDYTALDPRGAGTPDLRFERFSALNSSFTLLAPLAIAYFIGLVGARRERDATHQATVEPFHKALSAFFLLLLAAYFAAAPGLLLWGGGIAFAVGALFLSYRVYPAERRPDEVEPGRPRAVVAPADEWSQVEGASEAPAAAPAALDQVVALLDKAHGPLDPRSATAPASQEGPSSLAAFREMLPKAVSPLSLPEDDIPRPDGRAAPPRSGPEGPPTAKSAPAPPTPEAPTTRVRCPGCKHHFEAEGHRPLSITCPHCGRRGVLR
jgi:hypothetical protein